jgi:MarR family transcriptional regulator, lower aerobic nicotinate degradation pathway regulator
MKEQLPGDAQAPSRIEGKPTWLISRAYARSRGLLSDGFAAGGDGLRSYHYRLLAGLEERGPLSQADLGRGTGIDRSDVVTILGELERRGLIHRAPDPANLRRNIVSITAAGSERFKVLDQVLDQVQERVVAPLSPDERRQLTALLRKLTEDG